MDSTAATSHGFDPATRPGPVNMLWIGDTLGRIELLSIASWLRAGHRVRLHCYRPFDGLPSEVELIDASATAPWERMEPLRHRATGSFALASNYFRYKLQADGMGLWSDSDVVALHPLDISTDVLFGLEEDERINNAVLYLRKDLPIARDLVDLFKPKYFPPWTRQYLPRLHGLKQLIGRGKTPADMPWGSYGPTALTHLARKHRLLRQAKPIYVFYPLHYRDALKIFDPGISLDQLISKQTLTLHLWNEMLREVRAKTPPSSSPLGKLYREFGI